MSAARSEGGSRRLSEVRGERRSRLRDFFLGFVKIHILYHAAQEPVYSVAIIQEWRRHGYELSPGTLYPVLHALEQADYLSRENWVVAGKMRKYYPIRRIRQRLQLVSLTHAPALP